MDPSELHSYDTKYPRLFSQSYIYKKVGYKMQNGQLGSGLI